MAMNEGKAASRRMDGAALTLVTVIAAILTAWYIQFRRDLLVDSAFLFGDHGFYLQAIEEVLHGKAVFKDFAWQYGAAPVYLYAGTAAVFGNTPGVYLLTYGALTMLDVVLAFLCLRQTLDRASTVWAMALVVVPCFVRLGGAGLLLYLPLEIALLLGIGLTLRAPSERTAGNAAMTGILLGLMQWMKFGGAFVAGLAIVATDLMALHAAGWNRGAVVGWFRRSLVTLGAFLVVEAILVGWLVATLPGPLAKETIWPAYMLEHYHQHAGNVGERWPAFETMGILAGTQLPAVVWLGLSVVILFKLAKRSGGETAAPAGRQGMAFLGMFYLVGLVLYFKHKWLMYNYSCILCVPACWILWQCRKKITYALLLLMVPAFMAIPFKLSGWQKSGTEPVKLPNGQDLWLAPDEKLLAESLFAALQAVPDAGGKPGKGGHDPIMVLNGAGASIHFFGEYPKNGRHAWFLPNFVRPYEEESMVMGISQCKAILVFTRADAVERMTTDSKTWGIESWTPFSQTKNQEVLTQLQPPVKVSKRWVLFPVKR
jgi:hypothetical protein